MEPPSVQLGHCNHFELSSDVGKENQELVICGENRLRIGEASRSCLGVLAIQALSLGSKTGGRKRQEEGAFAR